MNGLRPRLALLGGEKTLQTRWPDWPQWDQADEAAVLESLRTGGWGICPDPSAVSRFAQSFAAAHDAQYGLCCCNGTVALMIALRAVGVLPGDEVIVPAYTFMATATAAIGIGAIPIVVDVEPSTLNLDPARLEAAVTERTRAVVPVHLAGLPASMDRIRAVADRKGLKVVEDCAQAHLAAFRGRRVGALGHAGAFSFQSSKNLTAGEGGVVTTDDPEVFRVAYAFHHCGRTEGGGWYEHPFMGQNLRMPQLQAALLESQMEKLAGQHETRQANGRYLSMKLSGIEGIRVIGWPWPEGVTSASYHILIFDLDSDRLEGITSRLFCEALRAEGVPCHGGYDKTLQDHGFYQDPFVARMFGDRKPDYKAMETPAARRAVQSSVWIKQHQLLCGLDLIDGMAEAVKKVAEHAGELVNARAG